MGFNLRPLEVSAAIASNQLKRLKSFAFVRDLNRKNIINYLKRHKNWDNQFTFVEPEKTLHLHGLVCLCLLLKSI